MFPTAIRIFCAVVVLAAGTAASAAVSASAPVQVASPTPLPSATAYPGVPYLVVAAAADKDKAAASQRTEGNVYTVLSTAIWASMWIVIALIARGAIATIVEGARPKQY